MQFGSRTYSQWQLELDAPISSPSTTSPTPPTWMVRISSGSTGVSSPSLLPKPCIPPLCTPDTSSASLAAPSAPSSPSTPPPSPRQVVKKRRRAPRALFEDGRRELSPRVLRGFVNCGNSCFTNVVLQALLACDSFRRLLLDCRELEEEEGLLGKFVSLAEEMSMGEMNGHMNGKKGNENGVVTEEPLVADWVLDVFPSSGGVGGSQEDAEEFLTFVLNGLHEELVELGGERMNGIMKNGWMGMEEVNGGGDGWEEITRRGKKVEIRGGEFKQSGITDIFGGALRSEIRRGRAKPSVTKEPFFSLSLDIESGMIRNVEDALKAYFEPEELEGYTLEGGKGGDVVDAKKQVMLQVLPQVLVLHLKRFAHNHVTGELNKVSRFMAFPDVLKIGASVMYGGGGKEYGLTAVVTHIGKDLAGGHYTCDVKWGDGWINCDDSKVVQSSLQKVLRKQAYLLFYCAK